MSWTYQHHRQPLDNVRESNGRFGVTGIPLTPPGSEAAIITVFKSDFLQQQPVDWHLTESGTTCPICLDEDNSVGTVPHVRLQCGHGIHMDCLSDFVLSGAVDLSADTVSCPLCRGDILPDIVQLRHHLIHTKLVKLTGRDSHPLRDLVFEDGHDPSLTETMLDEEIRAFCIPPGPVKYVSTKNPLTVCDHWDDLGVTGVPDPTEEIIALVRPATPVRPAVLPPVEETTPPPFINLTESPPPTPRPDRRVRRRLVDTRAPLPAHVVNLGPGTRVRVEEVQGTTARVIGLNLTEINRQISTSDLSRQSFGTSLSGNTRYSLTVLDVMVPGTGTTQRQLSITIDEADS